MPYRLEPYHGPASRYTCPRCGQHRRFTRYIDTDTGAHLAAHVGRCDRQDSCQYHYTPRQYYSDNGMAAPLSATHRIVLPPPPAVSYIPPLLYAQSLTDNACNLVQYLHRHFDADTVMQLRLRYLLGSSDHWAGATVYWQMDCRGRLRTGKVMLYDPHSGRRVKEPYNHISWIHTLAGLRGYQLRQCLYGEHLLRAEPHLPIAIVESEKTALIASVVEPRYIWMATGGKENLRPALLEPLAGRQVHLFPDAGAYELWCTRVKAWKQGRPHISDMLERMGLTDGEDIADIMGGNRVIGNRE